MWAEETWLHQWRDTRVAAPVWIPTGRHTQILIITFHYNGVIMSAMESQVTGVSIVCSSVGSGADQRKYQSSASLAFVWGTHRWSVNFRHKGPVTRKMFAFYDIILLLSGARDLHHIITPGIQLGSRLPGGAPRGFILRYLRVWICLLRGEHSHWHLHLCVLLFVTAWRVCSMAKRMLPSHQTAPGSRKEFAGYHHDEIGGKRLYACRGAEVVESP